MKHWFWLLGLPFLLHAEMTWHAEIQKPFALRIQLSSQQITIGESLDLEVECHYPSSYQLNMETLIDQLIWSANPLISQLNLLQTSIAALSAEDGMQARRLNAKILPLMVGSLDISFFTITFLSKQINQHPLQIKTPIFSLQVLPLSSSTTPLSFAPLIPLEPQFPLGLTQANEQLLIDNPEQLEKTKKTIQYKLAKHSFPWLEIVFFIGCGGIGWVVYLARDRWLKGPTPSVSTLSPKQQLHQALHALEKRQFLEDHQIRTLYEELASILLLALQFREGWKTQELTTREIEQVLKNSSQLSLSQKQTILSFLTEIDLVKFAGEAPTQRKAQDFYQDVQKFIHELTSSSGS